MREAAPRASFAGRGWGRPILAFVHRAPFVSFFLLVVLSNVVGSYFNITYNRHLIIEHHLEPEEVRTFWGLMVPVYNCGAYTVCFGLIVYFLWPIARARRDLRAGRPVSPERITACRRLLINLPIYQMALNFLGWIPGAVVFPLWVTAIRGWEGSGVIWLQFGVSFTISALLTTMQTFFLLEAFLIEVFYPDFFADARPAEVDGAVRVSLGWRVMLLWCSVALVPILALLLVTLNIDERRPGQMQDLRRLSAGVSIVGLPFSAFLMWLVGRNILSWVRSHGAATGAITRGDFKVRIEEKRPDELGQLTDRFNDMASALDQAEHLRETFGQFVSPDVRDEILKSYPDLGGEVQVVTVLFADIRGFTQRVAGETPEAVVSLLNRFLTLGVTAVEEKGGWVNKFLGDGLMALFGAPRSREDHADLALASAREFLTRLEGLNEDLAREGQAELRVGIGVHTGPALVGCIGASVETPRGRRVRREFTAIGETVNVTQRLEQLTKVHGGPVILSDETARCLLESLPLISLGPVSLPGYAGTLSVHRYDPLEPRAPLPV